MPFSNVNDLDVFLDVDDYRFLGFNFDGYRLCLVNLHLNFLESLTFGQNYFEIHNLNEIISKIINLTKKFHQNGVANQIIMNK